MRINAAYDFSFSLCRLTTTVCSSWGQHLKQISEINQARSRGATDLMTRRQISTEILRDLLAVAALLAAMVVVLILFGRILPF
jgi:hypothetical protein